MAYPPSDPLPIPGATTSRKFRPLPRPSQRQGQDRATYSGNNSRNQTSPISKSYTSADSAGSPTKAVPKTVGAHMLFESENHTNGAIANQVIYHGQWKRLGLIGKGSYGQVYRALDITAGYIFAVKTLDSTKIKRRTLVQALQDEHETLKELEHPNIVRYLGFEEDEGVLNIFLEYVPGGTIRSCLDSHGKFKEDVTKSFASQILQGLSYLHSKSILHRDLKSENILVEPRGICKISDFGISKKALEADRGHLYSIMKGTLAYMAPEMTNDKGYNSKVDIWSAGCIVLEMWTGKTPWSGSQDLQILLKLYEGEVALTCGPPLPDNISLSTTAESFRQEFFHFDPEKRPSAVQLLQHAYLKFSAQWVFPGVEEIGQVSNTSSEFITPKNIRPPHFRPSHNDIGTSSLMKDREHQNSPCESIHSDIQAMAAEFNLSLSNHGQRSSSLARSNVMHQASSPSLIPITPPVRLRKQYNCPNLDTHATISPSTNIQPSRQLLMHNYTVSDDTQNAPNRRSTRPTRSNRQPYVYQPPPLPAINVSLPYSCQLVPPISIRYNKPVSQIFSKRINLTKPVPGKLHGLSMDAKSVGNSVARLNRGKVHCSGQRGGPYMSSTESDDDEPYSSSTWKRPPVNIPRPHDIKPVESVSD